MARKPDMARRAEIAARAFEVIRARGVHKTSMSDIASALGMKRPTLYWYFNDLSEVFEAVVDENRDRLEAFVLARIGDLEHPIDVLRALVRAHMDFYEGRRDVLVALFQLWAVAGTDESSRILQSSRQFMQTVRSRLIDLVATGVADGRVAPCEPEQIVDLVLAVTDGSLMQRVTMQADPKMLVEGLDKHVLTPLRIQENDK